MEVIYRNGVSRTGRSPWLMLTSSSLSSASSSSSSPSPSFSFSPSSSSLHRRPYTARSTQPGKFRRCGNYVSRGLNFRLRRSTRGGVVNASAPRVADRRRAPRRSGRAKWLVMFSHVHVYRARIRRADICEL